MRRSSSPEPSATLKTERPPRTGVINVVALITVIATVVLAAGIFAHIALKSLDRASQLDKQASYRAQALAAAVEERMRTRRESVLALAGSQTVESALAEGDVEQRNTLAARYAEAFPQAQAVFLAPAGNLEARPEATPPVGYALIELVEDFDGDVAVEVHRPGASDAQMNIVASVRRDGRLLGHVIVMYPARVLGSDLAAGTEGAWRIVQTAGDSGATIAQSETTTNGPYRITAAVNGAPWTVQVVPSSAPGLLAGEASVRLVTLAAGGALVIGLVGILAGRRLRNAIVHDGNELRRLAVETAKGQTDTDYTAASPELKPVVEEAAEEVRAALREAAQQSIPESEPTPAARGSTTDTVPEDEPPTDEASSEPAPLEWDQPVNHEVASEQVQDEAADNQALPEGSEVPQTRPATVTVDPSILRAYDIRGVVGETLTRPVMRSLGQALGSEAADYDQQTVVVGYDGRHSSPELAAALIEGLVSAGRDVVDIGPVPTPLLYFATQKSGAGSGIMVTGSHNPPDYNGLKMIINGETLSGDRIKALGGRLEAGDLVEGEGRRVRRDVTDAYQEQITRGIKLARPLRIVVDAGNGIGGTVAPGLYEALGCQVMELFCDVDGDFPNHHPDPAVPENLDTLITTVKETGADLGLAFDGDADRLGVVDDKGKIIWADRQLMLFAQHVLAEQPGSDVVFDVKCTNRLPELITENAGIPVMWKTGHALIKGKLRETGAPLAGEMSGHFFFNDRWYGFDDAVYAGARLLEILAADDRRASAVFEELPEGLTTPELRADLAEGEPAQIMEGLVARAEHMGATRASTIDGLRLDFPDGWGLVRASNTQPCLVLRFEGDDEAALERIKSLFRECLKEARPGIRLPF